MKMKCLLVLTASLAASSVEAAGLPYLLGVDGREANPTGTYAGLANPNHDRITLLYNHGDHYHAKGVYTYTGPNLGADTAVVQSPSNYLPEGSAPPFALKQGSGVFAGLLISGQTPDVEASTVRIGSVDSLMGFPPDSPESILLNSSGGRWAGSLAEADLAIELVSLTTGLSILDVLGDSLFSGVGSTLALGLGDAALDFAPIFAAAKSGDYVAAFRVIDLRADGFGDSGVFEYRFNAAVPEPGTLVMSSIGGLAFTALTLLKRARRRSSLVQG